MEQRGFKIYKSLGLRNKDSDGKRLAIDDPRLDPIWAKCAEMGVPVLSMQPTLQSFWDDMNSDNDVVKELKQPIQPTLKSICYRPRHHLTD